MQPARLLPSDADAHAITDHRHCSGGKRGELQIIAPVEGQLRYLLIRDQGSYGRVFGLQ